VASRSELDSFLASTERRAFKHAMFAVRNEESALDIVQEAMMKLSEKYGDRPTTELPMLFQTILQNAIRDWFRRAKVRSANVINFSDMGSDDEDSNAEDYDPLETLEAQDGSQRQISAQDEVSHAQQVALIEEEIKKLPARQREAFLLRYWEDLDVAETAEAMGCTEGSVKTHCSRATHTLAVALKARGITFRQV
jgi:RNA polymerase sigma-70 factor, ECF subfamily